MRGGVFELDSDEENGISNIITSSRRLYVKILKDVISKSFVDENLMLGMKRYIFY